MAPSESKESKLLSSKAKEEGKIIQKVNCKISELITYKERQDITLTAGTAVHALVKFNTYLKYKFGQSKDAK